MIPEMKDSQKVSPQIGFVAFFDILGFSKMMLANPLKESLDIINEKMLKVLNKAEKQFEGKFEITVVSDSILITVPNPKKAGGFLFFCNEIMFDLLLEGLPVRGAIAWGEFNVHKERNKIVFIGQPIIDACKLAASIEIAACAVVPSSESKILCHGANGFLKHKTPLKNRRSCELYLLKHAEGSQLTREEIIEKFDAHKKHLDPDSFSKFNNTIEFFEKCEERNQLDHPAENCAKTKSK